MPDQNERKEEQQKQTVSTVGKEIRINLKEIIANTDLANTNVASQIYVKSVNLKLDQAELAVLYSRQILNDCCKMCNIEKILL